LRWVYRKGNYLQAMTGAALEGAVFKTGLAASGSSYSHPVFLQAGHIGRSENEMNITQYPDAS
jgi:hypothetical protein